MCDSYLHHMTRVLADNGLSSSDGLHHSDICLYWRLLKTFASLSKVDGIDLVVINKHHRINTICLLLIHFGQA